jgi:DNA-directed RNA polymerase specialized sigma24 family protein
MRGRGRFREESEFSTWLRAVALNALRDFIKAKGKRPELANMNVDKVLGGVHAPDSLFLSEAMRRLTPRQRHLIEWKYGDGLSYAEIADRLKTTDTAVSQALRRARLALKRAIETESALQT